MLGEPRVVAQAQQHVDRSDAHRQSRVMYQRSDVRADVVTHSDEPLDRGCAHLPVLIAECVQQLRQRTRIEVDGEAPCRSRAKRLNMRGGSIVR